MPQLDWQEHEFIQALSVLPTADEYGVQYTFDVTKSDIRLVLNAWQYESVVGISLHTASAPEPIADFVAFVRGPARRQETPELEWIELRDAVIAPSQFSYLELGDPFDRRRFPVGFPVRIYLAPQIRIGFMRECGSR